MDQRARYRCSRHKKMDHDYPECVAEARVAAPVVKLELAEVPRAEPKAKPKASSSRWAEYGRRGGQVGGIKVSPAKAAAAKVNGARGGRPRLMQKIGG
jgi:hypothetical protein